MRYPGLAIKAAIPAVTPRRIRVQEAMYQRGFVKGWSLLGKTTSNNQWSKQCDRNRDKAEQQIDAYQVSNFAQCLGAGCPVLPIDSSLEMSVRPHKDIDEDGDHDETE